eukprot:TRINITY_DN5667_c0_g1_i1.p1 TRINITY_DN5667_c0_g1~~TRINITY_DN5667_c0_g1_i1.p1  ORF type:complete len:208 (-),score=33.01 TRINITY_DN5667_c0_g1_i1:600-1223(-)
MATWNSLFLLLVCLSSTTFGSLVFQVEPKTSDCFYLFLNYGQNSKINFWITRGGLLDIDLRVHGPNNEQIFAGMQFEASNYEFVARSSGVHSICWNNEMSRWTAKVVEFEVLVDGKLIGSTTSETDVVTPGVLSPLEDSISKIGQYLDNIKGDQKYFRGREQKHRDTAESTNARVFWYSVVESAVLVAISLGQVFYLRRFFEIKRPL